tara:strand:- start:186 stop:485 length:300 start_codon:yes stop_codon:yes gene_type:complete
MKRTISSCKTGITTQIEMTETEIAELEAEHEASRQEFLRRYGPLYKLRQERNRLLKDTDWWASNDLSMTQEQKDYRQALRDLPANTPDPVSPTWPVSPV